MFDEKSRYAGVPTYEVTDRRGRTVKVVEAPPRRKASIAGYHAWRQGQRLDHMAYRYLDDPAGYWRIAEANEALLPEALAEEREVAIPGKGR